VVLIQEPPLRGWSRGRFFGTIVDFGLLDAKAHCWTSDRLWTRNTQGTCHGRLYDTMSAATELHLGLNGEVAIECDWIDKNTNQSYCHCDYIWIINLSMV